MQTQLPEANPNRTVFPFLKFYANFNGNFSMKKIMVRLTKVCDEIQTLLSKCNPWDE